MDAWLWLLAIICILSVFGCVALYVIIGKSRRVYPPLVPVPEAVKPPEQKIYVDLKPLEKAIQELPNKVLQSITSSTNTHRGATGELIGFLKLQASYDRIIPLGNVIDFIGIIFPKDGQEGRIDFIDCKTGNARLSAEQRIVKKLVDDKKMNFIKFVVNTSTGEDSGNP